MPRLLFEDTILDSTGKIKTVCASNVTAASQAVSSQFCNSIDLALLTIDSVQTVKELLRVTDKNLGKAAGTFWISGVFTEGSKHPRKEIKIDNKTYKNLQIRGKQISKDFGVVLTSNGEGYQLDGRNRANSYFCVCELI